MTIAIESRIKKPEPSTKDRTPSRLLIDYSDAELAKAILAVMANYDSVVVDNDFGTVVPGDEFVAMTREDENWNWRHDIW